MKSSILKDSYIDVHAESKSISWVEYNVSEVEQINIAEYNLLAPEYDLHSHETTRTLESLSWDSIHELENQYHLCSHSRSVLEVGSGTGNLTRKFLPLLDDNAEISFIDSSINMLHELAPKVEAINSKIKSHYICKSILSPKPDIIGSKHDLVLCGLADPYFINPLFFHLRSLCNTSSKLIITIPDYVWGLAERRDRLQVPVNRTRFKLISGEFVYPYSFIYSEPELNALLSSNGLRVIEKFTHTNSAPINDLPPSVICILAEFNF